MHIYKVPAAILLVFTLSACIGDTEQSDTGAQQSETLIPGVGVNGNLQVVPSKSEG